ncbi:winged helix-turn-helix domain-containing protein [Mucilaginibacter lappiensis]|uniref:DNA-binding winged helix-turn-helix (WHTH) protein n=1 Tax=Mucilaginibacter lappiensis TaxID=354630 RepID=A0A841JCG9_9SPHI|nr:winged helix-turn-helix domain-containing protein [Mucilaginibacter lappiensis]MBB6128324.1 DNA-binding winged helix-turn-helix (wHTH) protein [Mucilaginibacter lappiensis]
MKNKPFTINNRFLVTPELNTVTDNATGKESRLEPRLMAVLLLLVNQVNQLVTREQLVKDIWNDYGGGDEGLSQAISFLRKLLADQHKMIIETVPTKGYLLKAVVTEIMPPVIQSKKKRYWIAALILVVLVVLLLLMLPSGKPSGPTPNVVPRPGKAPSPKPSPKPFS